MKRFFFFFLMLLTLANSIHTPTEAQITPPSVKIETPKISQNDVFDVTFTFSESVTGFLPSELIVTNAIVTSSWKSGVDGGTAYTVTLTPTIDVWDTGTVTIQVPADVAEDTIGNGNTASQRVSVTVDRERPSVKRFEVPTIPQAGNFDVTIQFSEDVNDFQADDIRFRGATATVTNLQGGPRGYTVSIEPLSSGILTIELMRYAVEDVAGNGSFAADATVMIDLDPPTIAVSEVPSTVQKKPFIINITFSEVVTGFTESDFVLSSDIASVTGLNGRGATYTATITPNGTGAVTIQIPANVAEDAAGNGNTASNPVTLTTDIIALAPNWMPDPNLRVAVRKQLGLNEGEDFTQQQVRTLTTLEADMHDISNLKGLEHVPLLTTLGLKNNRITNLTPLRRLTKLTTLNLSGNGITDIRPLRRLTKLTTLNLDDNRLANISPVGKLTQLTTLNLSNNPIRHFIPLTKLTALTTLELSGTGMHKVNAISGLTALRTLNLSDNAITDVGPIVGLANLETLRLMGNPILNTAPLYPLTQAVPPINIDIEVAQYPPSEVNGDADLMLAMESLDLGVQGAPSIVETLSLLDRATLQERLERLRLKSDGSLKYRNAIALLESLLAQLHPTKTRLLANYPNPFNPETWLPYQLSIDSDVEIFIYDADGLLVRHLELGHQPSGYYIKKSRAAYWDGRNSMGERVPSGIYFYQLRAGSISPVRKMVILK